MTAVCRVTNPHQFELDGVSFLGTSGQNVDDVIKYSQQEDSLGVMEAILEVGGTGFKHFHVAWQYWSFMLSVPQCYAQKLVNSTQDDIHKWDGS